MIGRFAAWFGQLLVSIDQFVQTLIVGPFFVCKLVATCPSADETISSYVGRAVMRGARWARPVAFLIDGLFILLGAGPDHCRRNVETAFLGRAPTP